MKYLFLLALVISTQSFAATECKKIGVSGAVGTLFMFGAGVLTELAYCESDDGKYWVELGVGVGGTKTYDSPKNSSLFGQEEGILGVGAATIDIGTVYRDDSSGTFIDFSESKVAKFSFIGALSAEGDFSESGFLGVLGFGGGSGVFVLDMSKMHIKFSPQHITEAIVDLLDQNELELGETIISQKKLTRRGYR